MASPGELLPIADDDTAPEIVGGLVLVIDDEPLLLRSLDRILTAGRYRVLLAESEEDADPILSNP